MNSSKLSNGAEHPYYPLGVTIPNYIPNETGVSTNLPIFLAGWVVILATVWTVSSRVSPKMGMWDRFALGWFALCGCIHTFFEGYFSLNHARMGPSQSLFGQLWKEYALSDSRYLTSDSFVLWMETVTAFAWGPLSFALVYMISVKSPYRHITQVIVSLGQMYGLVLYFATSLFDDYWKGVTIGRPERYYFWFYYVFFNVIWFAIPGPLMVDSIRKIAQAFREADAARSSKVRANGVKKRM